MKLFGASAGIGKRLRWPDDYFMLSMSLSYTRYMLKNFDYFLVETGNCNNLSLGIDLSRVSTDNQLFPRRGSEFDLSVSITPPWSAFSNKDYKNLATDRNSKTYHQEQQEKYRWIEYHKWKFKSKTYTALTSGAKCFVLMTRIEFGILGSYNKYNLSPFETFYMGGDGMSGYSTGYGSETIGLRGYDNGSLSIHQITNIMAMHTTAILLSFVIHSCLVTLLFMVLPLQKVVMHGAMSSISIHSV